MRSIIFVFFLFSGLIAYGQEGFKGEHFIEVVGTADTEIDPNEITLFIRLREFEENKNKVQLEKLDKDFLAALKSADIDKKKLSLAGAGSKLSKLGRRDKDAFREKSYQLVLNSAAELERFLEKIEPVQVDQVVITRIHNTEMEKHKLDLKIKALQAARAKAENLLNGINSQIGKTLMVREWDNEQVHPVDMMTANVMVRQQKMEGAEVQDDSDIAFKKIRLRAQVSAQFEIK
jgi:uncharacterized protein